MTGSPPSQPGFWTPQGIATAVVGALSLVGVGVTNVRNDSSISTQQARLEAALGELQRDRQQDAEALERRLDQDARDMVRRLDSEQHVRIAMQESLAEARARLRELDKYASQQVERRNVEFEAADNHRDMMNREISDLRARVADLERDQAQMVGQFAGRLQAQGASPVERHHDQVHKQLLRAILRQPDPHVEPY